LDFRSDRYPLRVSSDVVTNNQPPRSEQRRAVAQQVVVWNCENTPQIVYSDTTLTQPRVPARSFSNIIPRGARRGVGWCVVVGTRPTPRRPAQGNFRPLEARLALAVYRETCQQIDSKALTAHDVVGCYSPTCREEVFSETARNKKTSHPHLRHLFMEHGLCQ
jgi:hypothetical protein